MFRHCAVMGRAHSCAVPSSPGIQGFNMPFGMSHRRAASSPEALPDFLTAAGMPTDTGCPGDTDGMTGKMRSSLQIFSDECHAANSDWSVLCPSITWAVFAVGIYRLRALCLGSVM